VAGTERAVPVGGTIFTTEPTRLAGLLAEGAWRVGVHPVSQRSYFATAVLGRSAELRQIEDWPPVARTVPGPGMAPALLVIEGKPGIGKTTLWAEAIRRASGLGWQVLSCRPVPSDAGLPYVGLADLVRPVPDELFGRLPQPQQGPPRS
jgi:hypothetical protein